MDRHHGFVPWNLCLSKNGFCLFAAVMGDRNVRSGVLFSEPKRGHDIQVVLGRVLNVFTDRPYKVGKKAVPPKGSVIGITSDPGVRT